MSFTKCWGLPPDLKITLTQFFTELEKYEEKDVNNWAVEKKITYYSEKMELLRGFLNNAKSGSNLSSSRPVSNTPQTTTVQPKKETPKETVKETPKETVKETPKDTFKETPRSEVKEIPRETVKETSKQVTNEPPKEDMVTTVRGIMNNVFRKVKAKVISETSYSGTEVMQTVKDIIVETTKSVINGNEHETTIKSIMNNVHRKIRASFEADQTYGDSEVLDIVKDTIKTITNEVIAANSPPETNVSSIKTVETSQPKRVEDANLRRVDSKSLGGSEGSQSAGIETQRRDAEARIKKNPGDKDVDLTDPEVLEYFIRVRDDKDPLTWIIYGYGDESKNKLQKIDSGEGNFNELKDNIPEYKPVYIYFKHVFGDTNRSKFIYITYTPESLNGLQKSRVLGHRGGVEEFFKYFQISWHIQDLNEIDEESLVKKLLSAGGANYSVQETDKGNFTDYKTKTKNFYSETEKRGDNIKYSNDQTPLSLTPMDISGRPTVAPTTQFLGNTKDLKK
jgi:hypothetical protein